MSADAHHSTSGRFYITIPIFYPNAKLHLGHAFATTLADILARYHRLKGEQVYFLTGADENTEKVVRAAQAAGKSTRQYLDEIITGFQGLFGSLSISYDQFIRTSDEKRHWPGAAELWERLVAAGDIEKRTYEGLYCVGHESFITEKDLVNGKCPDHDETPQKLKEENYFFKLSKYTAAIKEKIQSGEFSIVPETRKNEILSVLNDGLEDVSFSRPAEKMSVGIPVPGDPSQKIYVWCDALSNYISALGFGSSQTELYEKFWPADVHVIGKDILRFHAAIWPGMLLSAGLPLPKALLVHGFLTSGGRKMSKTLGNVIDPLELIEEYGAEAVRYYLARHISPFEDGDITKESFKEAYNANLANGLGNLASRTLTMAENYNVSHHDSIISIEDVDLNNFDIKRYMDKIWEGIQTLDRKIQEEEPFKKYKTDKEIAIYVISELCSSLSVIAKRLEPVMPKTSEKILSLLKDGRGVKPDAPLFPDRK